MEYRDTVKFAVPLASSILLLVAAPTAVDAQPCPRGNPSKTTYLFRSDLNRCEGTRSTPVAGGLSLAGITIGQPLIDGRSRLQLRVPRISGTAQPDVSLNSRNGNYQMKPIQLIPETGFYGFHWGSGVLTGAGIPLASLTGKAVIPTSPMLHVPVIFTAARQYTFHLYASEPMPLKTIEIRRENRVLHRYTLHRIDGELRLQWGGDAPAGLYQLVVQPADRRLRPINITFQHDPAWLR